MCVYVYVCRYVYIHVCMYDMKSKAVENTPTGSQERGYWGGGGSSRPRPGHQTQTASSLRASHTKL